MILIFALLLSSCSSPTHQLVQQQLFTFGTLVDISIWTDKPDKANLLIQQLSADFEHQHNEWHSSKKNSLLSKANQQLQQEQTATLDASLASLVKLAIKLSAQSEYLFNPAIGQLVDLWHFDQLDQQAVDEIVEAVLPPDKKQIQTLFDMLSSELDLVLTDQQGSLHNSLQIRSKNPAVKLNLGAFAKGYAVDQAIKSIQQAGFNHALVNAGGDIKAIGKKGDKLWNIGIRNPFYQQQTDSPVLASIKLNNNESIMTSGDYERYFSYQGKRYHHIIDPRTGFPSDGFHSVTIVHKDAALADAAATALFIAGPKNWKKIAKKMAVDQIMLLTQSDELIISEKLKPRLSIQNKQLKTTVVKLD